MKKFAEGLFVCLIFMTLFFLAACGEDSTSTDEAESGGENADSGGGGEATEITLGYSGPLSGHAALYGERTTNGLKMAVDEVNEAGGFEVDGQTYTFALSLLDDKYLPNETAANAKRLVQEDGAKIVYSPHSGGIYAMQVFNEQDNFLIAAYTSEPGIIEQGNSLTWRIPPGYDIYLEPFTKYQMERFGQKIAFLPTASQYGKDWAKALKPVWEENGGEIVYETEIDFSKETDFYTMVTNALKENPDVLFIGGPSEPTALVAKQARDLGFEGGFIIMDQAKLDEMAVILEGNLELLEGSIGVTPLVNSDYPGTDVFVEKYNELYGSNPGSEAGFHYVSVYALIEAMKLAGSVDDPKVIMENMNEAVQSIPEEKQVYTIQGVTEEGANELDLRVAAVEEGEIVQVTAEDLGLE